LLQRQTAAVPHVLHFDGHGFFGKRCNEAGCRKAYKQCTTQCECGSLLGEPQGYLVFEQLDGTADYISAQELGELLGNLERREQPNSEPGIALVVLSGCRTGMSRLSESVFNGVAQNLIGRGIPAVVAMQYSISVAAASAFAEYFYHSLKRKDSLVSALHEGQTAIGIEGNEWYRPVLYLRWEDNEGGQLFKMDIPSKSQGQHELKLPITLTPNQCKSLQTALISAFPEESDLEIMVQYYLQTALNRISRAKTYDKIVFDVIQWANARGKVSVLLQGASETNPDNPDLLQFISSL
jgi:hypothetical protein